MTSTDSLSFLVKTSLPIAILIISGVVLLHASISKPNNFNVIESRDQVKNVGASSRVKRDLYTYFTDFLNPVQMSPRIETTQTTSSKVQQAKIIEMMLHGWNGYKKFAWGGNELKPLSMQVHNPGIFGDSTRSMGATIIDSLDTLYLMGLVEEFENATNWLETSFNLNLDTKMSVFEVNIRIIGGLLSAFTLTQRRVFLDKAVDVANRMLPVFDTPTGIPISHFNPISAIWTRLGTSYGYCAVLAELGTLSLEFIYLTDLTGNQIYEQKVMKIYETLSKAKKTDGLYFDYINPTNGEWCSSHASMGAMSDSFYEYLLKVWLYKSKRDPLVLKMYLDAMEAIKKKLVRKSNSGLLYLSNYPSHDNSVKSMDHLACFAGGMFALTALQVPMTQAQRREYEILAEEITKTCRLSYTNTITKLGPESFYIDENYGPQPLDASYYLRPEVIESYYYMWIMTKDPKYREWAWEAVLAIEQSCRTPNGYSGIKNVNSANNGGRRYDYDDVQQSFFFAETLKYLYLIFSDQDLFPFDKYVFNTEAHPFRVRG